MQAWKHALADGQPKNITPPTHLLVVGRIKKNINNLVQKYHKIKVTLKQCITPRFFAQNHTNIIRSLIWQTRFLRHWRPQRRFSLVAVTLVWRSDLDLVTFMTWIRRLHLIDYYILKSDCDTSSRPGDMESQFFTCDLVTTLTLSLQLTKQYGCQPSTIRYLRAKFQLQIVCSSWDIAWRTQRYFKSPTQPPSHPISCLTANNLSCAEELQLIPHFSRHVILLYCNF